MHDEVLSFSVVTELKKDKVFLCEGKDGRYYVRKPTVGADTIVTFRRVRNRYLQKQSMLSTVYIPEYVTTSDGFDYFEYIEGYIEPWSEGVNSRAFGGRLISNLLVDKVLDLSADLDSVDVHTDFYWRNFVFMPCGRVGIIDWENIVESSTSSSRLAYLYCLMFENASFQRQLVAGAKKRGLIEYGQFRSDIITWTQRFKSQWRHNAGLVDIFSKIGDNVSNIYIYNALWNDVDLDALLKKSGYHVFEDLGQSRTRSSEIDCLPKLQRLEVDKYSLKGKKLLDVGCNAGWFLKEYAIRGAGTLVGIDVERNYCEIAETLLKRVYGFPDVQIHNADVLDYEGRDFDIITCTSMFHYVGEKERLFSKVAALLKVGGMFVLETPTQEEGPDIIVKDTVPVRYLPSRRYIERLASKSFNCVYFGSSNLPGRFVFHFIRQS